MKLLLRVIRVIRGWLNLGVAAVENQNVDAIIADLEASKDSAVSKIVTRTSALKAQIFDMEKELKTHEENEAKFEKATKRALAEGNEELAKDFAQKYSQEHSQVETLRAGVKSSNNLYDTLVAQQNNIINQYDSRIAQLKSNATAANVKEQLAAMSDAANFGADMSFEKALNDAEKLVSHKDSVESAKLQTAKDIKATDTSLEADKILLEQTREEALERFKSEMNLVDTESAEK